ncbi:MAG: hypothetical protein NVSMB25_07130 [Thermoleophilaceae bacterium]
MASIEASAAPPPPLVPGIAVAQTANPGALSVSASRHVLLGRRVLVRGRDSVTQAGREVAVQLRMSGGWRTVAHTRTQAGGRFTASYRPRRTGSYALRVSGVGPGGSKPARLAGKVNVYHAVSASFYGPGLYGGALACGGTLSPGRLGVANKELPCGTPVTLHYRSQTVTVRVIDRGPYVAGRAYDLTSATRDRLRFPSTGVVWASR